MLDDNVVRTDAHSPANQGDPRRRSGLSRNPDEWLGDVESRAVQIDDTADFEDDDARAAGC
jgi:hypothetical protein